MRIRVSLHWQATVFALGLAFAAGVAWADVTGSIQGVVRDRSQAVVAGAKITVTNTQTNFRSETVSAAYRILALPAGTYRLTVAASGFRMFTESNIEVKVAPGATRRSAAPPWYNRRAAFKNRKETKPASPGGLRC